MTTPRGLNGLAAYYSSEGGSNTSQAGSVEGDGFDSGFLDFARILCNNPIDAKRVFGEGSEACSPIIYLPEQVPSSSEVGGGVGASGGGSYDEGQEGPARVIEMKEYRLLVYVQDHVQVVVLLAGDAFESADGASSKDSDLLQTRRDESSEEQWRNNGGTTSDMMQSRMVKQERLHDTLRQVRARIDSHLKPEADQLSRAMLASFAKASKELNAQNKDGGLLDDLTVRFVHVNEANQVRFNSCLLPCALCVCEDWMVG
jgi:hypothetical protein